MKFTLMFKTPDVLEQLKEDVQSSELEIAEKLASKFLKYDELIEVEFDTEKQTATVVK